MCGCYYQLEQRSLGFQQRTGIFLCQWSHDNGDPQSFFDNGIKVMIIENHSPAISFSQTDRRLRVPFGPIDFQAAGRVLCVASSDTSIEGTRTRCYAAYQRCGLDQIPATLPLQTLLNILRRKKTRSCSRSQPTERIPSVYLR